MERYKVNGTKITMPTGWGDVKYNDALMIFEKDMAEVEIFSLFSGISVDKVKKFKGDDIYYFMKGFPFLSELPTGEDIPMTVMLNDQRLHLAKADSKDTFDFGQCEVGQVEDMKAMIPKVLNEFLEGEEREPTPIECIKVMPYIVAIYLQTYTCNTYDYKEAMNMVDDIKAQLSIKEVYNIGSFFLRRSTASINGLMRGALRQRSIIGKLKQAFKI